MMEQREARSGAEIKARACDLLIAFHTAEDGKAQEAAFAELESWIAEDPRHRQIYLQVERSWNVIGEALELSLGPRAAVGTTLASGRGVRHRLRSLVPHFERLTQVVQRVLTLWRRQ